TLAAVRKLRAEVIDPKVAEHQGRLFKTMGDGFLVEFPSVVNAVACAAAIQKAMVTRNTDLAEDRQIQLRIGIHLGDVISEDGDVYGDGVNVAARIEGLAPPGGIAVSAMVHDNVGGRLDLAFEDMGEQQLKNIVQAVRTYLVRTNAAAAAPRPNLSPSDKPSIAVLPFANMSGDPEQEYFADGISEDIITDLSRFRTLFVIARNSSFAFKGRAVDVKQIGHELGVRYVVEGSVRKMGGQVRITAQLIESEHGHHIWSERFDRRIEDLFAVQDEVTQTIVATLTGRLEDAEMRSVRLRRTTSMPAYDCVLRGVELLRGYGDDNNTRARELFEEAVALDPGFPLAHAYLGLSLLVENRYGSAPQAVKDRALDHALTAVRLEPREGRCHHFLGEVYGFRGEFDQAIEHHERALALNPNDANVIAGYGGMLATAGRAAEGAREIQRAMRLNPYHPEWYWVGLAIALYADRRYEECLKANDKIRAGKHHWQLARTAACLTQLGRAEEARQVVTEILRIKPDFRLRQEMPPYKFKADYDHLFDAMRKAGLPE
ncbi:MAG: adenylate/guanylate cyclase domain-containing protein, partial [Hyphomicrobiales bacterium]